MTWSAADISNVRSATTGTSTRRSDCRLAMETSIGRGCHGMRECSCARHAGRASAERAGRGALVAGGGAPRNAARNASSECLTPSLYKQQPQRQCASGDIVQIQVYHDARIVFARPAPPEGEGRRSCVGGTAFRSTSALPAKANGFVWLGAGRRGCVVVVVGLPQDCQCNLAALLPQSECGRSQACGHDCFLDRREATCRRRLRV